MPRSLSRYRKAAEVVAVDARGRRQRSRALRIGVGAAAGLTHTLQAGDRLDHLASRYYREPRKWWRICDANPAFLSPLALIGAEPIVTARLPLLVADGTPPLFNELLHRLRQINGVESVTLEESAELVSRRDPATGRTLQVERRSWEVLVVFNRLLATDEMLTAAVTAAGFVANQPQAVGRVGKPIGIPPDVSG